MLKFLLRFLLSALAIVSALTFILVNVPVVRDVAKSKMPLVIGALGVSEILALAAAAAMAYSYNILDVWKKRIGAEGEFFVLSLTGFTAWTTLRWPIWTRWGFLRRYCELQEIDADQYEDLFYRTGVYVAVLCVPFLYLGWRWLYEKFAPCVGRFFRSFDFYERVYFGSFWGIGTLILLLIAFQTSVFTYPMPIEKQAEEFPMGISVSDSALLVDGDTFCNNTSSANDIRQPLFAVFSSPFAMAAHFIALLTVFSLPGLFEYKYIYSIALAFWQIGAFAAVGIILRRIIASFTDSSFAWSAIILYSVSYSTVIFAFTVEQYAFSLLALIIFIGYAVLVRQNQTDLQREETSLNYSLMALAAIGTIATSIVPVIYFTIATARKVKTFLNDTLEIIAVGVGSIIVFSKFGLLFNLNQRVEALSAYADMDSSQLGPITKLEQYLHFVYSTLFSPEVFYDKGVVLQVLPKEIPIPLFLGAGLITAAAVLGFLLFYKNRFVQCCMIWIVFGFFLMGVMGWGSRENGMMLYSSYFAWAYISLIVLPVYKLTGRNHLKLGASIIMIFAFITAMETAQSVWEIVQESKNWMLLTPP